MLDYSVLAKAGISIAEFAAMITIKDDVTGEKRTVSRTAMYNWVRGKAQPSEKPAARINKVLTVLNSAVEGGDLPVDIALNRADRKVALVAALQKNIATS